MAHNTKNWQTQSICQSFPSSRAAFHVLSGRTAVKSLLYVHHYVTLHYDSPEIELLLLEHSFSLSDTPTYVNV